MQDYTSKWNNIGGQLKTQQLGSLGRTSSMGQGQQIGALGASAARGGANPLATAAGGMQQANYSNLGNMGSMYDGFLQNKQKGLDLQQKVLMGKMNATAQKSAAEDSRGPIDRLVGVFGL